LASTGWGREHTQILNYEDNCCFGPLEWDGALWWYYSESWDAFVANYAAALTATLQNIQPSSWQLVVDMVANQHQFSPYAECIILNSLGPPSDQSAAGPVATGAKHYCKKKYR